MSTPGSQGTNGLPRLSHVEAEQLLSARLDAPIPHEQNRTLLAHLSTCPSCRAFASRIESMSRGLRTLPMLPASPTVSRQVRERIAEGQSPWTRFRRIMVSGRWGAMPAMASALVLVAAVTFTLILRGDNGTGSNRTPIPAASSTDISMFGTGTPTVTETATQDYLVPTQAPFVTRAADDPSTAISVNVVPTETATLEPTASATAEPVETTEPTRAPTETPTSTATNEPTAEPSPTATSTSTTVDTATSIPEPTETQAPPSATATPTDEPTEEPTATPAKTATLEPTETNTSEASSTPTETPTETNTPKPTATRTPRPTETPEPTETNTPRPTNTPEPTGTNTPRPPTRTPTATEEPTEFVPPTIEPVNGQGNAGVDEATSEPEVTIEDVAPAEEPTSDDSSATRIQPTGGETETVDEETPASEVTEEITQEAGPLDDAEVLGQIGSGFSAPAGGLHMPADLEAFIVTGPDAALVVADPDGTLIQSLGAAWNPVWSPLGLVLLYTDLNSGTVAVWDREDQLIYTVSVSPDEDVPVDDIAIGWVGASLYYLRTFPDNSGYVELHKAEWNGENDEVIWSAEGFEYRGDQPLATLDGVLIPTSSSWLFIDPAGNEIDFGSNTAGFVGEPILSPFGSLMAYSVGTQVVVAPTSSPGSAQAIIEYPDGVSGFAFSPSGEEIVVADGVSLRIYSTEDGSLISEASGTTGAYIGHVHWAQDGIRYLEMGEMTTLNLIQPEAFI